MPTEDRVQLKGYPSAPVGGHNMNVSFAKDEAGRLELTISGGTTPAVAILSDVDAMHLADEIRQVFGSKATPPQQAQKPAMPPPTTPPPQTKPSGMVDSKQAKL